LTLAGRAPAVRYPEIGAFLNALFVRKSGRYSYHAWPFPPAGHGIDDDRLAFRAVQQLAQLAAC